MSDPDLGSQIAPSGVTRPNGRVVVTFGVIGPAIGVLVWLIYLVLTSGMPRPLPTFLVDTFLVGLGPGIMTAAVAVFAGARLRSRPAYVLLCTAFVTLLVGLPPLLLPGAPVTLPLMTGATGALAGIVCSLLSLAPVARS